MCLWGIVRDDRRCDACQSKTLLGQSPQTKLRINEPGDQYEQEANGVAAQVMQMSDTDFREQRKRGTGSFFS